MRRIRHIIKILIIIAVVQSNASADDQAALSLYKTCPLRVEEDCPISKDEQDKIGGISYFKCDINQDGLDDYLVRDEGENLSKYSSYKLLLTVKTGLEFAERTFTHERFCCVKNGVRSSFFGFSPGFIRRAEFIAAIDNQVDSIETEFNFSDPKTRELYKKFIKSDCDYSIIEGLQIVTAPGRLAN